MHQIPQVLLTFIRIMIVYNRLLMMKSKRLKNFCEVCRKQCKDQNGYHCHLNSGHHQKRLRQLATNPHQHIQKYSNQLQNRIVQILKSKYPGQAKDIQDIYQQYAEDKHHVKFNYTRWKDLGQFVEHLRNDVRNLKVVGKIPYCTVTYVVSKTADFMKQKKEEQSFMKKEKNKEIQEKKVEERIARVRAAEAERYKQAQQQMKNQQQQQQQQFDLDNQIFRFDFAEKTYQPSKLFTTEDIANPKEITQQKVSKPKTTNIQKLLDQIQNKEKKNEADKQGKNREELEEQFEWIIPGIIVKIKPHQIPEAFHGKKAAIVQVKEPFVAEIKIGTANLSVDQTNLQTVIPKLGNQVKILKGIHRSKNGILKEVSFQEGTGKIQIDGTIVETPFNEFSKIS